MLFSRGVSGTRVIDSSEKRTIDKYKFLGYGSQCKDGTYPHIYMTAAAAMGMTKTDVDIFCTRVEKTINEFIKEFGDPTRPIRTVVVVPSNISTSSSSSSSNTTVNTDETSRETQSNAINKDADNKK